MYSLSLGTSDLLTALKEGRSYLTFAPFGPGLELHAGEAILGDTAPWPAVNELEIQAGGLLAGDVVRVVTAMGSQAIVEAPTAGQVQATYTMEAPGFARIEIWRAFLPGISMLPVLISNPI